MEAFTLKGVWWLPENPDHEIAGILTFDPRGKTELEMFGSIKEGFSWEPKYQPIILGAGENGKAITLVGCIDLGTGSTVGQFQWLRPRYIPNLVIQGHHFNSIEEITFERLWVSYYGLAEWASTWKAWGNIDFDKPVPVQSTDDDIFAAVDGFTLIFRRGPSWSHQPFKEFSIRANAHVDVVVDKSWGYEQAISRVFQFGVFLSLVLKTSSWPISVEAINPSQPLLNLSIHYSPVTDYQESDRLSFHFMYFNLEDQGEKIEKRLANWFARTESLGQVYILFNRAISKRMYLEDKFLTFAKAIEVYHRQLYDEPYVEKEIFAQIRYILETSLPFSINKDLRQRIKNSIKYANGPSLGGRLRRIRRKHKLHNEQLFAEYDPFTIDVINTRNYLTHFDDSDEYKARLDIPSLRYMSERLRLILELCLLSEMGFSDEELQQMAAKNIPQDPERSSRQPPQPDS